MKNLPSWSLALAATDFQHLCLNPLWERERPWASAVRVTMLIIVLLALRQMPPVCEINIHL
ncbi:hypothetical protein ACQEVF_47345 [Nonomuraea polychroma]|uniref:hypothetical protein n=1 Tax=Nonomuraea polychroma TaxID=46176 RepID=UPI003D8E07D3